MDFRFVKISFVFRDLTEFAIISQTTRGNRCLEYDGFRFGQIQNASTNEACRWRCTSNIENTKNRRCNATLTTRIVDGYEMIKLKECVHQHARYPWTFSDIVEEKKRNQRYINRVIHFENVIEFLFHSISDSNTDKLVPFLVINTKFLIFSRLNHICKYRSVGSRTPSFIIRWISFRNFRQIRMHLEMHFPNRKHEQTMQRYNTNETHWRLRNDRIHQMYSPTCETIAN